MSHIISTYLHLSRKRLDMHKETLVLWSILHCEDKNSAKYYFPTPEEKRKARIDVTRLQILQFVAWM